MTARKHAIVVIMALATALVMAVNVPTADAAVRDRHMKHGRTNHKGGKVTYVADRAGTVRAIVSVYPKHNEVRALDDSSDGHSAVAVIWKKGHYHHRLRYWDTYGLLEYGTRHYAYKRGAQLYLKACYGNWGTKHVIRCSAPVAFKA